MNRRSSGMTHWVIPDGFIPPDSNGAQTSHESICVLNTSTNDTNLRIHIYFEDQEPLENIQEKVQAKRSRHIRTSGLEKAGRKIPIGVPYAIELESDLPIIVQYSRLDSTQPELALMSTIAHPLD